MSVPITLYRRLAGVLTDATTVTLSDQTSTFGILRLDAYVPVVAAGTATTHPSTGIYQYDISALDPRYTYIASWKIVTSYGTEFWTELINPQGTVVTRGDIRAEAARAMGLLVAEGTTTAATSLTIQDQSGSTGGLASDSDSTYLYDGCYCLMVSGPAAGYWREVSENKFAPSTGTLQVATAFATSALPTATGGDRYQIYAGLSPHDWSLRDNYSIVDNALERCRFQRRTPLTLIQDGSMEDAGVGAWTTNNCSLAKTAIDSVAYGSQALLQVNAAPNAYAQATALPVIPGHGYSAWVDYRCLGTSKSTASMQIWDNTNTLLIQTATDPDNGINFEGGRMSCSFTVPANCYSVGVRLYGAETTAVIAWDNLIVITAGRRRYSTPTWIKNRNQIMSYMIRDGARPFEDDWSIIGWPTDIQEDPTAVATFIIDIPSVAQNRPLFVMGEGAYGPMSGVSDNLVTSCPAEWAKYSAAREAWQSYSRAIEGATLPRATADRTIIEARAVQLDKLYMPVYENSIGFPNRLAGSEITRLP